MAWLEARGGERMRVTAWTCDCRAMVYELCQAGGQAFIRRTLQSEESPQLWETHRWRVAAAREVWAALLSGMAR